jgi:hypothetical protein
MDNINSKCNNVTHEYKEKYDKLLSLVNGYEIANDTQNKNMKALSDIISNTKELISESDFTTLKNEQHNIMKDFFRLEEIKDEPYSNESEVFLKRKQNSEDTKSIKSNETEIKSSKIIDIKDKYSLGSIYDLKSRNKSQPQSQPQPQPQPQSQPQPQPQPIMINPNDPNYKVFSNFQGQTPQIPSIQIVNVQEAPKSIETKKTKGDLNSTINKFIEKTRVVEKNVKPTPEKIKIVEKIKNPKLKKQVTKIIKAKKTNPNYFNEFIEDYTLNMNVSEPTQKNKSAKVKKNIKKSVREPKKRVHSKKCHKNKFIPSINNSSNDHTLF